MVEIGTSEMEAGEWGLRGWYRVRCKPELFELHLAEFNEFQISSLYMTAVIKKIMR